MKSPLKPGHWPQTPRTSPVPGNWCAGVAADSSEWPLTLRPGPMAMQILQDQHFSLVKVSDHESSTILIHFNHSYVKQPKSNHSIMIHI